MAKREKSAVAAAHHPPHKHPRITVIEKNIPKPKPSGRRRPPATLLVLIGIVVVSLVVAAAVLLMPRGAVAKSGDTVSVDYVGKYFDTGTVFDTSLEAVAKSTSGLYDSARAYQPLQFTIGAGELIPGFDKAVIGMRVGQTKTVKVLPEDGYGYPQPSLIGNVTPISARTTAPLTLLQQKGIDPTVGTQLPTTYGTATIESVNDTDATVLFTPKPGDAFFFPSGEEGRVTASYIEGDNLTITVDLNPLLAGQTLQFEITLRSVQPKAAS